MSIVVGLFFCSLWGSLVAFVGREKRGVTHASDGVAVEEERPAVLAGATASARLEQRLEAHAALPLQQVARRVAGTGESLVRSVGG